MYSIKYCIEVREYLRNIFSFLHDGDRFHNQKEYLTVLNKGQLGKEARSKWYKLLKQVADIIEFEGTREILILKIHYDREIILPNNKTRIGKYNLPCAKMLASFLYKELRKNEQDNLIGYFFTNNLLTATQLNKVKYDIDQHLIAKVYKQIMDTTCDYDISIYMVQDCINTIYSVSRDIVSSGLGYLHKTGVIKHETAYLKLQDYQWYNPTEEEVKLFRDYFIKERGGDKKIISLVDNILIARKANEKLSSEHNYKLYHVQYVATDKKKLNTFIGTNGMRTDDKHTYRSEIYDMFRKKIIETMNTIYPDTNKVVWLVDYLLDIDTTTFKLGGENWLHSLDTIKIPLV